MMFITKTGQLFELSGFGLDGFSDSRHFYLVGVGLGVKVAVGGGAPVVILITS